MNVTTNLSKADLIKFNMLFVPRVKINYVFMAILFVLLFVSRGFPQTEKEWFVSLLSSIITAVFVVVIGVSFNILLVIFGMYKRVLGQHQFSIDEVGLHEKTAVNESLHKWQGISDVSVLGTYLIITIEGSQYHIIPKRSFASDADFDRFVTMVKDYHHNHV